MNSHLPSEALESWSAALRARLDLADDVLPIDLVLDVASEVAHGVARPAAPLSAFAAGYAAAQHGGSPDAVRAALASVLALVSQWAEEMPDGHR